MHGKIKIGYCSGKMMCFPPLDGGWTNAHGSDARSRLRRWLRQKVLAKNRARVAGQGAVEVVDENGHGAGAVEDKDGQGGENGVAA